MSYRLNCCNAYRPCALPVCALTLAVLFFGIRSGPSGVECLAQQPSPPASAGSESTKELVQFVKLPKWASKVANGLMEARTFAARPTNRTDKSIDLLCQLDDEVDMLAAALIQLRQSAAASELYERWYAGTSSRTPASILLWTQALRQDAFDAMDDQNDRGKAFETAQIKLSQALNKIRSVREEIARINLDVSSTDLDPGSLVSWFRAGVPRFKFWDKQKKKPDNDPGGVHLEPLPLFEIIDLVHSAFYWEAKVARELGDLIYRDTGAGVSLATRSNTSGGHQMTAAAYYQQARSVLFVARLLRPDDKQLAHETDLVETRIGWIKSGRPYGGEDFYVYDWYLPGLNYLYVWDDKLEAKIVTLEGIISRQRDDRIKAESWVQSIGEGNEVRERLQKQHRQLIATQIGSRIDSADLKLAELQTESARESLQQIQKTINNVLTNASIDLAEQSMAYDFGKDERIAIREANRLMGELASLGDMKRLFPEKDDWIAAILSGRGQSFERWIERTGKIEAKLATLDVAKIELEMAQADLSNYELVQQIKGFESEASQTAKLLTDASLALLALQDKNEDLQKDADRRGLYEQVRNLYVPRLEGELAEANRKVDAVRNHLTRFADAIQKTRKTIASFIRTKETVQKGYEQLKGLIDSINLQPSVTAVATSTSQGTETTYDFGAMFDRVSASLKNGWDNLLKNLKDEQKFELTLVDLEKTAREWESKLSEHQSFVSRKKLEYLQALDTAADKAGLTVPPEYIIDEYLEKPLGRFEDWGKKNVRKISRDLTALEEAVRAELASTYLESAADEVGVKQKEVAQRIALLNQQINNKIEDSVKELGKDAGAAVRELLNYKPSDEPDNYAQLWKQISAQRINLEAARAAAELRHEAANARVAAARGLIGSFEREQLQRRVDIAAANWKKESFLLQELRTKQEMLLSQLQGTRELLAFAEDAVNALKDFNKDLGKKLEALEGREKLAQSTVDNLRAKREHGIQTKLDELTAELQRLDRPEGRMLTADMLRRLTPALTAMEQSASWSQELRDGLDEANTLLLNYARWLYLLGGDRRCLIYGTPCSSLAELKLSKASLDEIRAQIEKSFGNFAGVGVVAVSAGSDQLEKVGKGGSFVLQLKRTAESPKFETHSVPISGAVTPKYPGRANTRSIFRVYNDGEVPPDSNLIQFPINEELRHPAMAVSFLPVIEWTADRDVQRDGEVQAGPTLEWIVKCVPKGAVSLVTEAGSRRLPIWYDAAYPRQTTDMLRTTPVEVTEEFTKLLDLGLQAVGSNAVNSLGILGNPGSLPNSYIFGSGLETTFWIEFKKAGQQTKPSAAEMESLLRKVQSFDIYIFYLDRSRHNFPIPDSQISKADLQLDHIKEPDNEDKPVAFQQSDSARFGGFHDLWNAPADLDDKVIEDAVEELISQARPNSPSHTDKEIEEALDASLGKVFSSEVGSEGTIFGVPSLTGAIQVIAGINHILVEQLTEDYVNPLEIAADTIETGKHAREKLGCINDAFAIWNARRDNVNEHLDELSKVKVALTESKVSNENWPALDYQAESIVERLTERESNRVWKSLLTEEETKSKAEAYLVNYVLERILTQVQTEQTKDTAEATGASGSGN